MASGVSRWALIRKRCASDWAERGCPHPQQPRENGETSFRAPFRDFHLRGGKNDLRSLYRTVYRCAEMKNARSRASKRHFSRERNREFAARYSFVLSILCINGTEVQAMNSAPEAQVRYIRESRAEDGAKAHYGQFGSEL